MTNIELANYEGILKYAEELSKVKALSRDYYTVSGAAEFFGIEKNSIIKGYHSRQKSIFKDTVVVRGYNGNQTTIFTKDGMFLLAILLNKKSIVSTEVFINVLKRLAADSNNIKEEEVVEEEAVVEKTSKAEDLQLLSEEEREELAKFLAKRLFEGFNQETAQDNQEEELEEDIFEKIISNGVPSSNAEMLEGLKDMIESGIAIEEIKITKIDIETGVSHSLDFNQFVEELSYIAELSKEELEIVEIVKDYFDNLNKDGKIQVQEEAVEENTFNKRPSFESSKEVSEIDALVEDLKLEKAFSDSELVSYEHDLAIINSMVGSYLHRCQLLGFEPLEAQLMVQKFVVDDLDEKDIDTAILNSLIAKKELDLAKKRGSLREMINLLAQERFDGDYEAAYHEVSNEMKFVIGINMTKIRAQKKKSKSEESYLNMIMNQNAFDEAMEVIAHLLND